MCMTRAIRIRSNRPIIAYRRMEIPKLSRLETRALSAIRRVPFLITNLTAELAQLSSNSLEEFGYHSSISRFVEQSAWLILIYPTQLLFTDGFDLTSTSFKIIFPLHGELGSSIKRAITWDSLSQGINKVLNEEEDSDEPCERIENIEIDNDVIFFHYVNGYYSTHNVPPNDPISFSVLDDRQAKVLRRYWK